GDLDEDQVGEVAVALGVLAQRHDVDVVVDEDRPGQGPGEVARHVEAVPAGHDWRAHGTTGGELHGARQADAGAGDVVERAAGLLQQGEGGPRDEVEHRLGPVGDVEVLQVLGEHAVGQVG